MDLEFERKLTIPRETKALYPLTAELAPIVEARAATLRAIFEGRDPRWLLVIGPCSADRADSVLAYLYRLRELFKNMELYIVAGADVIANASAYKKKPEPWSIHSMNHIIFTRPDQPQNLPNEARVLKGDVIELHLPPELQAEIVKRSMHDKL